MYLHTITHCILHIRTHKKVNILFHNNNIYIDEWFKCLHNRKTCFLCMMIMFRRLYGQYIIIIIMWDARHIQVQVHFLFLLFSNTRMTFTSVLFAIICNKSKTLTRDMQKNDLYTYWTFNILHRIHMA